MNTQKALTETELNTALTHINSRLKAAKLGVSVQLRGKCLSLVATLPPRPGSTRVKRHQQRISLKLLANPKGLKQAEAEAKLLGARIASREFDWAFYLDCEEETTENACGVWIEAFKAHIITTLFAEHNSEAAELLWRRRFYNLGLSRLNPAEDLTASALIAAAQKSKANSRSRQLYCQNLDRLAKFADVAVDLNPYKGNYSPKKAAPRCIPSDEAIEANVERFKCRGWRWVAGMMAAYGLRDHEAFFTEVEWREEKGKPPLLIAKITEGKTGSREVLPLHPKWVDKWHLWDKHLPNVTTRIHEEYGERVSRAFNRNGVEFDPYDLRHAYAIRASVEYKLPVAVAAALCGHSPSEHLSKYNRWINWQQHNKAWSEAVSHHESSQSASA